MAKTTQLTRDGLEKLKSELEYLRTTGRTDIAEKIRVARGYGDLSENSEYDEAKNEQAKIEARIREIENMLKNKEVIRDKDMDASVIGIGRAFKIRDMELKETMEYEMVNSTNANTLMGKISDESPVGEALVGHKKGETVKVEIGNREVRYKILDVQKA